MELDKAWDSHPQRQQPVRMPQCESSRNKRTPVMSDHDLIVTIISKRRDQRRVNALTAFDTPMTSKRAARSAHSFLVEYSSAARGLSVPPYPSISGTTTRYPACTQGPIWYRQPYLNIASSTKSED